MTLNRDEQIFHLVEDNKFAVGMTMQICEILFRRAQSAFTDDIHSTHPSLGGIVLYTEYV